MLLDLRFGPRSAVALAAVVAALAAAGPAAAGTVTVRNDGDAAAAGEELVNAVSSANAGDVIVLSPGDYNPPAPLDVTKDVTVVGPERAPGARITAGALTKRSAISDGFDLVAVDNGATATIRDVALTGTGPSGIAVDVFGGLVLEDSVVGGNNGLAVAAQPDASVTIRNTTISDNSTGLSAAAGAKISTQNVTIAGNRRGGIFNAGGGAVDLSSTIVWGNGSPADHAGDCQRRLGGDAPGSAANSIDGDGTCGANIKANPLLGRLEDNGGPTATRSLASGSPAINAGSGCTGSDQRGASRVGACDIGAFEYGGSAPPGASPPPASGSGGGAGPGPGSGSGSGQGGSTPPGSGGSGPGGAGSGKPLTGGDKSAGGLPRKHPRTLDARGVLLGRHGTASFHLHAGDGKHVGLVVVTDPLARIRLRATRVGSVTFDARRGTATVRGTALEQLSRRRVAFAIVVSSRSGGSVRIRLSNGYARSGSVKRGSVSIKA